MNNEQTTPETKGVTVKPLAALDLSPEIDGMALRMRMVTIEPGGVFGPRIGTPYTGLRTEERFRQWKSRSMLSGRSRLRPDIQHVRASQI